MKQEVRNGANHLPASPRPDRVERLGRQSSSDRLALYARHNGTGLDAGFYAMVAARWWKVIVGTTVAAVIATGLYSKFGLQRLYRASAILQPTPYSSADEFAGMVGTQGGADLSWLVGEPGKAESSAHEYMTVLSSFTFQVALARRHHIAAQTFGAAPAARSEFKNNWAVHHALARRFKSDYSFRSGHVTLSFADTDPERAARILGYFIDDLRDQLRVEEVKNRRAAAETLRTEINETTDPVLAQSLYSLVAREIQRQKLAQVEADFAFKVLSPPVPPDAPFWPSTRTNCMMAAFLAISVLGGLLFVYDFLMLLRIRRRASQELIEESAEDTKVQVQLQ